MQGSPVLESFCDCSILPWYYFSGYMTLHKDTISDLHIKVRSSISNPMLSYSFRSDRQWRLQQIQDAGNSIELASVYAQNGAKYAKKALRIVLRFILLLYHAWLLN